MRANETALTKFPPLLIYVRSVGVWPAGLVNASQTAVEAKLEALAAARVPALNARGFATGTATGSILIA